MRTMPTHDRFENDHRRAMTKRGLISVTILAMVSVATAQSAKDLAEAERIVRHQSGLSHSEQVQILNRLLNSRLQWTQEANLLNTLGDIYQSDGNFPAAFTTYQRAAQRSEQTSGLFLRGVQGMQDCARTESQKQAVQSALDVVRRSSYDSIERNMADHLLHQGAYAIEPGIVPLTSDQIGDFARQVANGPENPDAPIKPLVDLNSDHGLAVTKRDFERARLIESNLEPSLKKYPEIFEMTLNRMSAENASSQEILAAIAKAPPVAQNLTGTRFRKFVALHDGQESKRLKHHMAFAETLLKDGKKYRTLEPPSAWREALLTQMLFDYESLKDSVSAQRIARILLAEFPESKARLADRKTMIDLAREVNNGPPSSPVLLGSVAAFSTLGGIAWFSVRSTRPGKQK